MARVALAHHWLTNDRGGEKVLAAMASLFEPCDLYTLVHDPRLDISALREHRVLVSWLNRMPGALKCFRHMLPAHPAAIAALRVPDDVDLLLSSDASMIKGLTVGADTTHVCYCHSPPRYLWELSEDYKRDSLAARMALDQVAPALQRFDFDAAQQVSYFIANSHFVADRIRKYYGRESKVIHPPVAVQDFQADRRREPFSLVISELVPYKRVDLAIEAFNQLGTRLVVIGDGPQRKRLESLAHANVEFLGRQPFETLKWHYERASAFIFPGIEDFGITPVEAQASGCPVLAFRAGGALETILEGRTGMFFDEQSPECLAEAVQRFAVCEFDSAACANHAAEFSEDTFRKRLLGFLSVVAPACVPAQDGPLAGRQSEAGV